jgi:hypothetical protein
MNIADHKDQSRGVSRGADPSAGANHNPNSEKSSTIIKTSLLEVSRTDPGGCYAGTNHGLKVSSLEEELHLRMLFYDWRS